MYHFMSISFALFSILHIPTFKVKNYQNYYRSVLCLTSPHLVTALPSIMKLELYSDFDFHCK